MLKIARFVGCWFLFFFFVFTFIPVKMPCSATVFVVTIMALHTYLACSKEKVSYRLRSEKWLAISQFFFYLLQKKKKIHSFTVEFYQLVFWRYYYPVNIQVKAELDVFYFPSCNHKITYGYKYGWVIWITHLKRELCIKQKIHFSGVVFASPFLALS